MTRWLVTGAAGMLGRQVAATLASAGQTGVTAASRSELDLTDAAAVDEYVRDHDIVINAAGWTDVDGAERHEAQASAINGHAVADLARACERAGTVLLHLSTDYVLPGDGQQPYPEDAPTGPVNAYGRGKLLGEQAALAYAPTCGYVVRTAWLYGEYGRNFVTTMLRLARAQPTVNVVADQYGQPTWAGALAEQLVALGRAATVGLAAPGVYHATSTGHTTWYGFARAVFAEDGLDPARVRPITTEAMPRPARRPSYSVLGHERWGATPVTLQPPWQEQLRRALPDLIRAEAQVLHGP